ncbi:uncharacterized protein LOC126903135 [Daktulosphaira vitifoliae]|uniref:uncharacterized protein LOC126903135 n=1 Tax=Daktulosphaira vitifoliae TaxID=58002 RepID=UPI0021AA6015|nr:uncharacterized protein LOC126903135 [Daktulosphaira vitifoliae]
MNFYIVCTVLATLALHSLAEDVKENASTTSAVDRMSNSLKTNVIPNNESNNEWSVVPKGYGGALATGGAVVVGIVVLLAIAAVVSPLFGYRLCQIFSTCDAATTGTAFSGDGYSGYATAPSYSTYQKRSIEYVGPILQALNSAYEKYGHGTTNPISQAIKKSAQQ